MELEIDLEELLVANQVMDYDSDTSNEDPTNEGENEDDQWETEWSEQELGGQSEPSQEDRDEEISEPKNEHRRKRQK